jgi:hypothetical protein
MVATRPPEGDHGFDLVVSGVGGSGEPAAATGAADFSSAAVYVAESTIAISAILVFFFCIISKKNCKKPLGLVLSINIYIYKYFCKIFLKKGVLRIHRGAVQSLLHFG